MQEEEFDVLNRDGSPALQRLPRSVVHAEGHWHRSVHVWIVDEKEGTLLLQMRAPDKDTFPNRLDVSAAGHIAAGEGSWDTALRELEEELGVELDDRGASVKVYSREESALLHVAQPLRLLFTAESENQGETPAHGKFVDRELQDVYLLVTREALDLSKLKLQQSEVLGVRFLPWTQYRDALCAGDEAFVPRPAEYARRFFKILHEQTNLKS
ncbi:Nudix hydrolase 3 [Porphyridium purpureum]|uniref:Nudix hydrolase 3 n=1 Tax=Porphyridium purpureum TaxID=35688 RepID=A0A5J4YWH2_PORPP|nr:Nudix hydrolase 3 [Porphyridium purpureum]|eukprot:POR5860..scf209_3